MIKFHGIMAVITASCIAATTFFIKFSVIKVSPPYHKYNRYYGKEATFFPISSSKQNSETPRYKNANYRGFSDIITALNAEKDSFSTATSYILTANLVGGAPHLIVFGIDDTGYGAGLYINYAGKISFFKIEKGSFYNFKMQ